MIELPKALKPLADYRQFILYKLVKVPDKEKLQKLPVDYRTLEVFKKEDEWQDTPEAWTDAATALSMASMCGPEFGVGFFFTVNDPFYFLDIDHCLQADNTWSPVARALMGALPGAAIEISASGDGLHVFGKGTCPDHGCKNIALDLELYTERRFVALTGNGAMGNAGVDHSTMLPGLVAQYFPPKITANSAEWTDGPIEGSTPIKDDKKLLEKMLASKSVASTFGDTASFAELWTRDVSALALAYAPDAADKGEFDESSADAGLAQHLAFWTGNDCDRIERLMRQSALVRPKWDRKSDDYLKRTIVRAVSLQAVFYTNGKTPEPPRVSVDPSGSPLGVTNGPVFVDGYQFLGLSQQVEHFDKCVYIQDIHRVFTPSGTFLKSEQFNATYGGYVFQLEDKTSGKTTQKAWEAFTESRAIRYPKAESTTFKPEIAPGEIINVDGRSLINTYIPIITPRIDGDATPFLTHLAKILPNEHDRAILLAYMAACIQHKGVKFQWAPLIQGVPGNGKTLFSRCVAFAIGARYSHMPRAEQIAEKFNTWLFNMLFIGVEDIYVPDHKSEIIEILKPMITADRYEKRGMQADQVMQDICCNFIFNSNYKDAVRKTKNDRRFAIFYSAQQTIEDLTRDGIEGDYFPELYRWLKADGYAIVANYLATYDIPEALNPATACHRAPKTSTTNEAISMSMGGVEQEIIEVIDEGRPGFAGGWVSSMALNSLLELLRKKTAITLSKRREMMEGLGYILHPGLHGGRVNNNVLPDGGKPRLYIKEGHISLNLTSAVDIAKAYQTAQQPATGQPTAASTFNRSDER